MTSAAVELVCQSSTYGDELLCSKWAEARVSAYGHVHFPVCGHDHSPRHTHLQWPWHPHEHEHGMYIDAESSVRKMDARGHGLCKANVSPSHMQYNSPTDLSQRCMEDLERHFPGLDEANGLQHATMDKGIFIGLIKRCIEEEDMEVGRQLQNVAIANDLHLDELVGSHLIHMFSSFGELLEARHIFSNLPTPDVFSWSAIISAHAKLGYLDQAFALYHQMRNSIMQPDSHVFVALLQACSASSSLSKGRSMHSDILEFDHIEYLHVCNSLIEMYGRCGSVKDSCLVFQRLREAGVDTWNSLIRSFADNGNNTGSFEVFEQMQSCCTDPDDITYINILNTCGGKAHLEQGRMIYSQIMEKGVELDLPIANSLIEMFCRCDDFTDACCTFHRLKMQDVAVWCTVISRFFELGKCQEAIRLLQVMQDHNIKPDWGMLVWCLRELLGIVSIKEGELLHSYIVKAGMEAVDILGRKLVDMYFLSGSAEQAHKIFNNMQAPDVVAWSALIRGYFESGHDQQAFDCFNKMQEYGILPDQYTAACILKGCSGLAALDSGQKIHFLAVAIGFELNIVVCNSLIVMYSKCGSLEDARAVFDRLSERDVITWNSMIDGYSKHGFAETALNLFHQMCQKGIQPNLVTFVCTLKACSAMQDIELGWQIHAQLMERAIKLDPVISNALLDMYSKCGSFEDAQYLFDGLSKQAVIPWNTFMAGYSLYNHGHATLELFRQMKLEGPEPDSITFVCVLKACLGLRDIEQGKEMHSHIVKTGLEMDVYIGNILVSMYGHCGSMEDAHKVFNLMRKRDIVTWSALMTGYIHSGHSKEVLAIFEEMWIKGMELDEAAFVCVLKACSDTAALEQGTTSHGYAVEKACELNPPIASTLITMYGKCGALDTACLVFNKLSRQTVISYNAMLAVLGEHGESRFSIQLFESMKQAGMKPNNITFTCLLSACRNLELVDEGCYHFTSMQADHGIIPEAEHYGCIVDILGKGRLVDEAEDLLETIPMASNIVSWTSLLSSCHGHYDIELGKRCFNCAVNIDPANSAVYVLMSNLYKCAGLHKSAEEVESLRKHGNKWKKPGRAYIEINKKVHEFVVGDKTHPQIEKIQLKVKGLRKKIADRISVLYPNLPNSSMAIEGKEDNLCGHSEKLALAFGLLSTNAGTTIRVAKNIRMCADCHMTSRLTSLIEKREIIITDSYRVHNFRDGLCSCKD